MEDNILKTKDDYCSDFINAAAIFHNNKYDYSKVDYVNSKIKVEIICPIHGSFFQQPIEHKKYGCRKCSYSVPKGFIKTVMDTQLFIKKATEKHGDKYIYDKVEYKKSNEKVIITCKKHGDFEQTPNNHMRYGCIGCAIVSKKERAIEFIEKSKIIHNDKYCYKKVLSEYKNQRKKVSIKCKIHGFFKQTPSSHVSGKGCPDCNLSKGEESIGFYLKYKNIDFEREFSFEDCLSVRGYKLRFDFFVKLLNLIIEFDGEQHFNPIKIWGGVNKLKELQENDKIKNKYCFENNINMLRINYKEDLKKKLGDYLNIIIEQKSKLTPCDA